MREKPEIRIVGKAVANVQPSLANRDKFDDDQRRLLLSLVNLMKRKYPNDWRKLLEEMTQMKAA